MDFYRHQERAYHNSAVLLGVLLASVFFIVSYSYVLLRLILYFPAWDRFIAYGCALQGKDPTTCHTFWLPELYLFLLVLLSTTIVGTVLTYLYELHDPAFFATRVLGGRELVGTSKKLHEQKLLNIVEEMSIASGLPVPQVFVLPGQQGINALALGLSPRKAGLCVTEGCLTALSRDELQAVIAHEFSHILNEDVKFNLHLLAILHGVLCLALWGRHFLEAHLRSRREFTAFRVFAQTIGSLFYVLSLPPVLFATAIQRAISRQREFLADAFAVQFTRNVDGLANALKTIKTHMQRSRVHHPYADEAAHMFFACVHGSTASRIFSTHPPLLERIRRVSPYKAHVVKSEVRAAASESWDEFMDEQKSKLPPSSQMIPSDLAYAHHIVESIPPDIHAACHSPRSASLVIATLLFDKADNEVLSRQLDYIAASSLFDSGSAIMLFKEVARLSKEYRLPLIEVCLPQLQRLSKEEKKEFLVVLRALAKADKKLSLFEYITIALMRSALLEKQRSALGATFSMQELSPQFRLVLSLISHLGHTYEEDARGSYQKAAERVLVTEPLLTRSVCTLPATAKALNDIATAIRPIREAFLDACLLCTSYDRVITVEEGEILRAIGMIIEIPVPLAIGPHVPADEKKLPSDLRLEH